MSAVLDALYQFHFLRPLWLLLLLPLGILCWILWRKRQSAASWRTLIAPHLLPHLLTSGGERSARLPLYLLACGWLLATLAGAGPTWEQIAQPVKKRQEATVLILDLSLSMYASDLEPSRLTRARLKLMDILDSREEGLYALVAYAGTAHVVTPLTDDTNTIRNLVGSLSPDIMPIPGNAPDAAVAAATNLLEQAGVARGQLLLITDSLPDAKVPRLEEALARNALSVMALGTREGAPIRLPDGSFLKDSRGSIVIPGLNIEQMKENASALDARFSTLTTDDSDLRYLLGDTSRLSSDLRETERAFDSWEDMGPWLALVLLPLAALGARRGWLTAWLVSIGIGISGLLLPQPALAFEWADLWRNQDQQAAQRLREGDPAAAAEQFNDEAWRAYSHYEAGQYDQAEAVYRNGDTATDFYNLGNTLAQQQRFAEAISAYDEALKRDPTMADAETNRAVVEQLQQQQQQQQQSGDGEGEGEGDQNDDSQPSAGNNDQQNSESNDGAGDDSRADSESAGMGADGNPPPAPSDTSAADQDQPDAQDEAAAQPNANEPSADKSTPDKPSPETETSADQATPSQPDESAETPEPESDTDTTAAATGELAPEDQQALDQWLRRVPDDPGGLLRRKFRQESQFNEPHQRGTELW